MDRIVGGKFKLGKKIGCGSFGVIYLGERSIDSPPGFSISATAFNSLNLFCPVFNSVVSSMLLLVQERIWTPTRSSR